MEDKYLFPLILLIYDMITGRSFVIWDGKRISQMVFLLLEGLGQGIVSSPPLFNIYTKEVLKFKIERSITKNNSLRIERLAFADDLIVYVIGEDPAQICEALERIVKVINEYYLLRNLKINPSKCETIVFHEPLRFLTPSTREKIKKFKITIRLDNVEHLVQHKNVVKYLGVKLDY